jgi:hypothetical protein
MDPKMTRIIENLLTSVPNHMGHTSVIAAQLKQSFEEWVRERTWGQQENTYRTH